MKNIELKVKINNKDDLLDKLKKAAVRNEGVLHQIDIYFNCENGRLKLREINSSQFELIYYQRPDNEEPELSSYEILELDQDKATQLKNALKLAYGIKVIVEKERSLWIYKNTRVHLDSVKNLGEYLELETVLKNISEDEGLLEHNEVINLLALNNSKKESLSYSDLPNMPETAYGKIISFEEFDKIRDSLGTIVCSSGGYDPIHPGHATNLIESKRYGDTLVVIVNGDAFLRDKKGKPFMDLKTRCQIVSCIRGVDYVIPFEIENDPTVCVALEKIKPHIFTKGGDRTDYANIPEWDICQRLKIKIIPQVGLPKDWSSSDFLKEWGEFYQQVLAERA